MKKEFECPQLIIIYLEGDLLTVSGGDNVDTGNDENGSGYNYPQVNP